MKPIRFARRRELDREAERIGRAYDDHERFSDPKQHPYTPIPLLDNARCGWCQQPKEAHEEEKKS